METVSDSDGNTNNLLSVEPVSHVDDEENKEDATPGNVHNSLESEGDEVRNYLNEVSESSDETFNVNLKWSGSAQSVDVVGEFSNWRPLTMSRDEKDLWKIELKLKRGTHLLKFIVDGKDALSEYMETIVENNESFNVLHVETCLIETPATLNGCINQESVIDTMKRQNVTDEMMKKVEFVEETLHVAVEHTRDALDGNDEVTDVNIQWKGTADNVLVSGEFSNWSGISLAKIEEDVWSVRLKLKFGDYLMFFFVDGEIMIVEDMEQVHCKDEDEIYNILRVLPEMDTELDFKDEAMCTTENIANIEIADDSTHENQSSFHMSKTNIVNKDLAPDDNSALDEIDCDYEKQISWKGFANDVRVIGDFSNWTPITLSNQGGENWCVTLKLAEGPHLLKFIVDKKITLAETMEKVIGPDQELYNLVHVGTNNGQVYEIRYVVCPLMFYKIHLCTLFLNCI